MMDEIITKDKQIFDEPLTYVEPVKAMAWIHELLSMYNAQEGDLQLYFRFICALTNKFTQYIQQHKFVTMKQSEV